MKITLLVIGKTSASYLREGIDTYLKRLEHYMPFEIKVLSDIRTSKSMNHDVQKEKEGEMILSAVPQGAWLWLLDEHGREYTSREFAEVLDRRIMTAGKDIVFVIGGPYGFSSAVYARSDAKISFSRMTFSHEMIRLIFVEQLYRAFTILRGEPYHHD